MYKMIFVLLLLFLCETIDVEEVEYKGTIIHY